MADHRFDLNFSLVFSISCLFACIVLPKIYLSQSIWLSGMSIYYMELLRILGGLLLFCFLSMLLSSQNSFSFYICSFLVSSSHFFQGHRPYGRKRRTKEPLDESERGEWKTKIMASSPITSWQIHGETVETVTDFILGGLQNHFRWWLQPWN